MAKVRRQLIVKHAVRSLIEQRSLISLRLLFLSGVVAVIAVASILSLTSFMKATLISSSSELLAGDRQIVSPRPVDQLWLDEAEKIGLKTSLAVEFRTMVFSDTSSQLVEVKAVDDAYPLKGNLELEGNAEGHIYRGTAVMQARLFDLLGLGKGQNLVVGEADLPLSDILIQEPDVGFNIGGLQPRVLMHLDDLERTKVLQPGSRSKWRYYLAGTQDQLAQFDLFIEDRVNSSQRYQGVQGGRPAIASALERSEAYLMLASSLCVLLGCLAIALCARQYAMQQVMDVAILKTLGFRPSDITRLFLFKLLCISLIVLVLGLLVSQGLAIYMIDLVRPLFDGVDLSNPYELKPEAVLVATAMTLFSVCGFSAPQILALSRVSPQAVLRPETGVLPRASNFLYGFAVCLIASLVFAYSENIKLVALFAVASTALVALVGGLVYAIFRLLMARRLESGSRSVSWRLARNGLSSEPRKTVFQASIYAFALCLLALIFIVRDSLLGQWQAQLPDDAPNHFLINIRDNQINDVNALLSEFTSGPSKMYPMVRGRLSHINDVDVKVAVTKDVGALNRELNLSWASSLPEDNEIIEGQWFDSLKVRNDGHKAVSVEAELADNIGINVGDELTFTIGPEKVPAVVASIRTVQWESMRPNFYVFFEKGALDGYPGSFITSFYLAPENKARLNAFAREFPTISVLEVDVLIDKIRGIVNQVSKMLEVVLALVLCSALLVVAAITSSKLNERIHEAGVVRTFGVRSIVLRKAYFLEFALLGLIASTAGLLCAELGLNLVTGIFLSGNIVVHGYLWLTYPIMSALLLGSLGYGLLRRVLKQPAISILR